MSFSDFIRDVRPIEPISTEARSFGPIPSKIYTILFTARSGSSWLGDILRHQAGIPDEYFNPEFIPRIASELSTSDAAMYIERVVRAKSHNNVFGLETTSAHISIVGEQEFLNHFAGWPVVFLWRENIVLQAISLFRAVRTGVFHSIQSIPVEFPTYDGEAIKNWVQHILDVENGNVISMDHFRSHRCVVSYEDLCKDPEVVLERISSCIEVDIDASRIESRYKKIGDAWSIDLEQRFRSEFTSFVSLTEQRRLATNFRV